MVNGINISNIAPKKHLSYQTYFKSVQDSMVLALK